MLEISPLNASHSGILSEILSTDIPLHSFLSPNQEMTFISDEDYLRGCREWEKKKNGKCYTVILDKKPIGSISYVHVSETTASVGCWLKSHLWNKGYGTDMMILFMSIVKARGYQYMTGSIQKSNPRSKRCLKNVALSLQRMKRDIFRYSDYEHTMKVIANSLPIFRILKDLPEPGCTSGRFHGMIILQS